MSSSQGYGKPVGSGLCSFMSWRQEPTEGYGHSYILAVRRALYSWPGCTELACMGFRCSQAVFILVNMFCFSAILSSS